MRARVSTRCGVKRSQHQRARVRLRDLEDVEVRVELDADRAERRDRLVEQHEARRQPQVHRVDQLERLADHLQRVDLGEAARRSSGSRARAARRRTPPRAPSGSGRRARRAAAASASTFSFAASMKSRVSFDMSSSVSFPTWPKSTRPICSRVAEHEDVRRVRVAVEEPVPEDHRHPRLGHQVREAAALLERPYASSGEVGELDALEQLERQHARARVAPVDARDAHVRVAGEVAVERLGVAAPRAGSRAPAGSSARTRRRARARR